MEVVLLGATGLIGHKVLLLLLEQSSVSKVHVVSRKKVPVISSKINLIEIKDLKDLKQIDLLAERAVYVSSLGSTIKKAGSKEEFKKVDLEANLDFAELASRSQASKFILVSAAGANPRSLIFYNRIKGKAEKLIQGLGLASFVVYRPGLLIGDREEQRSGEKLAIDLVRSLQGVLPSSWMQKIATDADVLAAAICKQVVSNQQTGFLAIESGEIVFR